MTEEKPRTKFEFVCMEETCMKDGGSPCMITIWSECEPDYPNYCPWEFDPAEHKYKPWKKMKG